VYFLAVDDVILLLRIVTELFSNYKVIHKTLQ